MGEQLKGIKSLNREREYRRFYKKVNATRKGFKPQTSQCKDLRGNLLCSKEEVSKRWVQHFGMLLNIDKDRERERGGRGS